MAFTLSHAAVAPLLYPLFRQQIPLAALAFGAMAPDMLRLFGSQSYFGHTWSGVFTIDVMVSLILCGLWYALYRPLIYALFNRTPLPLTGGWIHGLLVHLVGAIIGSITHLIWDGFTHNDFRRFSWSAEFLQHMVALPFLTAPMPLYHVLQYATSLVALPLLGLLLKPLLGAPQATKNHAMIARVLLLFCTVCGVVWVMHDLNRLYILLQQDFYDYFGRICFDFGRGFVASLSVCGLLFRAIIYRRS